MLTVTVAFHIPPVLEVIHQLAVAKSKLSHLYASACPTIGGRRSKGMGQQRRVLRSLASPRCMPDPYILKVLFSVQRLHDGVPSVLAFLGSGFILLDRLRLRLLPHLLYNLYASFLGTQYNSFPRNFQFSLLYLRLLLGIYARNIPGKYRLALYLPVIDRLGRGPNIFTNAYASLLI